MALSKNDKLTFIDDLMSSITGTIKNNVGEMPEDWDGIELRWYIADKVAELTAWRSSPATTKRHKDYENEVIVRNL